MGATTRRPKLRGVLAVAAGLLLAVSASGSILADDMGVQILDDGFSPAEVTLHPAGAAVHWLNAGTQSHSVKFADGVESPVLAPGESFQRTFTALGDYAYTCGVHPEVTGIVHVVEMPPADDGGGGGGNTLPGTDTAADAAGGLPPVGLAVVALGSAFVASILLRRRLSGA